MIKELNIRITNITNNNASKILPVNSQQHNTPNETAAVSA
jgi:hypothetical protein